jgi:hypothetical protein
VFEIGEIYMGPEHERSWGRAAVKRVFELLAGETDAGSVGLLLHVGGSISEPAWTGLAGRVQRRASRVTFDIGVPASVQDDALETQLLDFAEEAVGIAASVCQRARVRFDEQAHRRLVTEARRRLAQLAPPSERIREHDDAAGRAARYHTRHGPPAVYPEPGARSQMFRVQFRWQDQRDLDALFALEERVDETLTSADVGEVDGNEVGSGSYTLFVTPERRAAARARELVAGQISAARLEKLVTGPSAFRRRYVDRTEVAATRRNRSNQ